MKRRVRLYCQTLGPWKRMNQGEGWFDFKEIVFTERRCLPRSLVTFTWRTCLIGLRRFAIVFALVARFGSSSQGFLFSTFSWPRRNFMNARVYLLGSLSGVKYFSNLGSHFASTGAFLPSVRWTYYVDNHIICQPRALLALLLQFHFVSRQVSSSTIDSTRPIHDFTEVRKVVDGPSSLGMAGERPSS
jgi:hypothetical protein